RRTNDVAGELERVDGGVAAHEADDRALDAWSEAAAADQFEIHSRCRHSRAGGDDEVADLANFIAETEAIDGLLGEGRGLGGVAAHALSSRGKPARDVKAVGRVDAGPSALNARPLHHAIEEEARTPVAEQPPGEVHECLVHV